MDKIMNKSVECRDNQDNVKLCISADTYLESVFYNLCAQDERKVRIIMNGRIIRTDMYIRLQL